MVPVRAHSAAPPSAHANPRLCRPVWQLATEATEAFLTSVLYKGQKLSELASREQVNVVDMAWSLDANGKFRCPSWEEKQPTPPRFLPGHVCLCFLQG